MADIEPRPRRRAHGRATTGRQTTRRAQARAARATGECPSEARRGLCASAASSATSASISTQARSSASPGLIGSRRTELSGPSSAADRFDSGSLEIDGRRVTVQRARRQAIAAGIGFVPEDRHRDGLMLGLAVTENLPWRRSALSDAGFCSTAGGMAAAARRSIASLYIQPPDPARLVRLLSGGNQQKVLVGKWLNAQAAHPDPRRTDGRRRCRRQGRDLRHPARRARRGRGHPRGFVRPRGGHDHRRPDRQ